jgi:hypothetical protein
LDKLFDKDKTDQAHDFDTTAQTVESSLVHLLDISGLYIL